MPTKRIFTDEEKEKMINLYKNGALVKEIAKIMSISIPLASQTLKGWGVNIINPTKVLHFDVEKDIIPLLEQGYSLSQIEKKVNNTRHTISRALKRKGYEVVNRQNETKFNETVFDIIDTEEKAYWLGFLYADGYLSQNEKNGKHKYLVELSLSLCDIEHLYKFQDFLQFNHDRVRTSKIKLNGKDFFRCRLSFSNKHVWSRLNDYGCTPNKSLTLKFPSEDIFFNRDKKLIISFIKGYFEGDGCLSYIKHNSQKGERCSAVSSIVGTEEFLSTLAEYIEVKKSIKLTNKNKSNSNGKTYTLFIRQKDTQRLIHMFYDNSTVHLTRKYNRAVLFKDQIVDNEELLEFLTQENDNTELIKETNFKNQNYE